MNNAIEFAKEIKQKKYAIEKSNSPNLKKTIPKKHKEGRRGLEVLLQSEEYII